MVIMTI